MLRHLGDGARRDGGRSLVVVTRCYRSPTLSRALDLLGAQLPGLRRIEYEPFDQASRRRGARLVFGCDLEPVYDFRRAAIALALGADPLGMDGDALRAARGWADRRTGDASTSRLYVVESSLSITGSVADHRFPCRVSEQPAFLAAAALELARESGMSLAEGLKAPLQRAAGPLRGDTWANRVRAIVRDLLVHRGESLVVVGRLHGPEVHGLGCWMNEVLDNVPSTLRYVTSATKASTGTDALAELADGLERGEVQTLLLLGVNPVYDTPGDLDFARALGRAKQSVHLGLYNDETSALCSWHVNEAHPFEAWSDTLACDGTASIAQPLIAPLWNGRTAAELVSVMLGKDETAYQLVLGTWRERLLGTEFKRRWHQALSEGVVDIGKGDHGASDPSASDSAAVAADGPTLVQAWERRLPARHDGIEVAIVPDPHAFDGYFANNTWLHELPDPFTKVTWGNPARVSAILAQRFDLEDGDWVRLRVGGRALEIPVIVTPGQASDTITLTMGQGRRAGGTIARSTGFDVRALRSIASPFHAVGVSLERLGPRWQFARAQRQFSALGRDIVLSSRVGESLSQGLLAVRPSEPAAQAPRAKSGVQAWGMSIDLAKCTGCGACVVGCQSENNVPVVGAREIQRGGLMHWLRIDRYYEGAGDDVVAVAQPVPCQHCENAPCEAVCPVGATTHSPEGLNEMVYSRCVGSRYCASNCPYSVRRFNYFENAASLGHGTRMRLNPEVTVRSRGVMEKCTLCVQRINRARIVAKRDGRRPIRDGEVQAACEQACPTGAIVFGDLSDTESRLSAAARNPRAYSLLAELGTRPRVFYLRRLVNPNPELG